MNQFALNDQGELISINHLSRITLSSTALTLWFDGATSVSYTYSDAAHALQAFLNYETMFQSLPNDKSLIEMPSTIVVGASLAATSLSVTSGAPGTKTTLTGAGFTAAPYLYIVLGQVFITSFRVIDDTHVELVVPTQPYQPSGLQVDLKVSYFANGSGSVGLTNAFTYP